MRSAATGLQCHPGACRRDP